ncbi:hypothetical protein DID73_00070 [Candidatus Marinamargulisbacteria bacterium SCGC AG-343-K17]|nr:hypothetical protein DID73_00070 [Candidatus Marinamargulisbacteria bacterium SCGC AG-343-K17]
MMNRILFFMVFFIVSLVARPITFQLYIYDSLNEAPLTTDSEVAIQSSFIDSNKKVYFVSAQDQKITNGILHMKLDVDMTDLTQLMAFDQSGLQLKITLLDDELLMPLESMPLSIMSSLSDRTIQIKDPSLMMIQYDDSVVNIGGGRATEDALNINGALRADYFKGNGQFVYNAVGGGFNDDHSLEKNFSRSCPPNVDRPECSYGDDIIYINSAPFVGINNRQPEMLLDMTGLVLFTKGQDNAGGLNFPLKKHQSVMVWDHDSAAFKAGYVSRDVSVSLDGFTRSSVAIGNDVSILGRSSSVFGGAHHTIYGDFSSVLGGKNNEVTGNYSVLVGSSFENINKSYVTTVGGQNNIVSSNYSVLMSSENNALGGNYITVMGNNNLVDGNSIFIYGDNNQVSSSHSVIFGDSSLIEHDHSWVINVSSDFLSQTTNSNQTIWMADQGVSINSDDYSEMLVVGGDVWAEMIYGDGSQLTNVSAVDKYWLMYDDLMTNAEYSLGIGTGNKRNNRVNLRYGLTLSSDGSSMPGTIAYEGGDLVGYGETATKSLLIQDTDTIYTVSPELTKDNNVISISTNNVVLNDFLVYTGQIWEPRQKSLWADSSSFVSYSRPISLWRSDSYYGMLTLAHPIKNQLVFSNSALSSGISMEVAGMKDVNQRFGFGFNMTNISTNQPFPGLSDSYLFQFDALNGGVLVKQLSRSLMEIDRYGTVNFFGDNGLMDVNIPTKSRINKLVIDDGSESQLSHIDFSSQPFLSVNNDGRIKFQTPGTSTINLRILSQNYSSLFNQTRLQLTHHSELILSHKDTYSLGQPMIVVPDGNMVMDEGYQLGVFNDTRQLQTGVQFNPDSLSFIPDSSGLNNVFFHELGLGIRVTPDRLMVIQDADVSMFVEKASKNGASSLVFSREMVPKWMLRSSVDGTKSIATIKNEANSEILYLGNDIHINSPANPSKELSVKGDMVLIDSTLYLTQSNNPQQPENSKPFAMASDGQLIIRPIDDTSGLELHAKGVSKMKVQHGKLTIGTQDVPNTPTNSLYVRDGSFISDRLKLNNERIEYKTIRTPANRFTHHKDNMVQELSFDFDSGFDISKPSDNTVLLTFQDHFSSMNTISANALVDGDTQIITPNGIDMMSYLGDNISVLATNVAAQGDPDGAMDSLLFFNDLMNGGTINGDLLISATLNVFGNDSNGVVHGLEGDISEMYNIPFPWQHVVTENGVTVNYEYVITENVGIGLTAPEYSLDVAGVTSINIVESPLVKVQQAFVSNKDYLNIMSNSNEMFVTVNSVGGTVGPFIRFSGAEIKDGVFGLNGLNDAYSMSFYPKSEGIHSDIYIEGKESALLSIHNAFNLLFGSTGDVHIKAMNGVDDLVFMNNKTSLFVSSEKRLGIGILKKPQNSLDVSGNMVIGSALAGTIQAPPNSMMVQGRMGIGTNQPDAFTDVQGAMVVGESDAYMGALTGLNNDLVIQTKLFVDEYDATMADSMLVNGDMVGIGGLHFNKSGSNASSELSFFNDSDTRFVIGYGSSVVNRALNISGKTYVNLVPKPNVDGLYMDASGRLALGHKAPTALLHIKKGGVHLKLEAAGNGDSTIRFESGTNGLMGISSSVGGQFIMSDGENPQIAGADLSIDGSGNVDIGYNAAAPSTVQPTHVVRMDINGKLNATNLKENNQVLTHMPEGSIVMWSGWTSALPDGWELCDGTTSCPENLVTYFIVGKNTGDTLGESVGAHNYSIATSSDYSHKHVSTHDHAGFTSTSHDHDDVTIPNKKGTFETANSNVPGSTQSTGEEGYSSKHWHEVVWGCLYGVCVYHEEKYWRWNDYSSASGGHSGPSTANGKHNHTVTINHGHTGSVSAKSHNHTLSNTSHEHDNTKHDHDVQNEPVYYELAFIYLKGEG